MVNTKGEQLEKIKEMLCKNNIMEYEIRKRRLQGRRAIGEIGRSLRVEVKRSLRESIVLSTLTYGSEEQK